MRRLRDALKHHVVHVLLGRRRGGGPVTYERSGMRVRTIGVKEAIDHPEIAVEVSSGALIPAAYRFLQFVVRYLDKTKARIKPGETFLYGFWQVRFERCGPNCIEAWDVVPDTTNQYQAKADIALGIDDRQLQTAARLDAGFDPPRGDMLFAGDDAVLSADAPIVELTRDPPSGEFSGWYIVTNRFGGSAEELRREHLYHLVLKRPEVVDYLGLPPGWTIQLEGGERASFEQPETTNSR